MATLSNLYSAVGGTVGYSCMCVNNNETELYIIGGGWSNNASYIYDISGNSWTTGISLTYSRAMATCQVNDSNWLYVLGGRADAIEKIDLSNKTSWIIVSTSSFANI